MSMSLIDAFRELRRQWFYQFLASRAPESDAETELQERLRIGNDLELRDIYDAQTEAIIRQENCLGIPVCPRCLNDMLQARRQRM